MSTQCQCEITPAQGPFVLGPPPQPAQCTNRTTHFMIEKEPDEDDYRGKMAVCASCLEIAKAQGITDTCDVVELVFK